MIKVFMKCNIYYDRYCNCAYQFIDTNSNKLYFLLLNDNLHSAPKLFVLEYYQCMQNQPLKRLGGMFGYCIKSFRVAQQSSSLFYFSFDGIVPYGTLCSPGTFITIAFQIRRLPFDSKTDSLNLIITSSMINQYMLKLYFLPFM